MQNQNHRQLRGKGFDVVIKRRVIKVAPQIERIFIALYPVLHMNVYLTWILDSHPQYPVCTIVITYEITQFHSRQSHHFGPQLRCS